MMKYASLFALLVVYVSADTAKFVEYYCEGNPTIYDKFAYLKCEEIYPKQEILTQLYCVKKNFPDENPIKLPTCYSYMDEYKAKVNACFVDEVKNHPERHVNEERLKKLATKFEACIAKLPHAS